MNYTYTYVHKGRIGNQLYRNVALSLIVKKFDLYAEYSNNNFFKAMGINLYCGKNKYPTTIELNNNNYFDIYNSNELKNNLDANEAYFQTYDISKLIYNFLNEESNKLNIIEKNIFKDRYNNNNDCFVHVRLTDAADIEYNPVVDYYINAISMVNYDNLYIATDEPSHPKINKLLLLFPKAQLFLRNEYETILFGSTCKNVILSRGTFSNFIGFLSYYSKIYYPKNESQCDEYSDRIFPIDENKLIRVDF